jgi:threonine synthase
MSSKEVANPWLVRIQHKYYGGDVYCGYCGSQMFSRYEIHMELCPNCFERLVKCFPKLKSVEVEKKDLRQEDRAKNELEKLIDDEIKFWSTTKSHIPPNIKVFPEKLTLSTEEFFDIVREYVLFELNFLRDKLSKKI